MSGVVSKRRIWRKILESLGNITEIKAHEMVVFKNDDIIAINKPPGITVHGGPGVLQEASILSYTHYWKYGYDIEPMPVHRIDRHTTGILLLARHQDAAREFKALFREKKIIKKYWALTISVPEKPHGSITLPLDVKDIATSGKKSSYRVIVRTDKHEHFSEEKAGTKLRGTNIQLAWTKYWTVDTIGKRCALLEVQNVTGFRNQIRVHLADGIFCPIVGDFKFAGPLFKQTSRFTRKFKAIYTNPLYTAGPVYLHCHRVEIQRDGRKPIIIDAKPPSYFLRTMRGLGLQFLIKN